MNTMRPHKSFIFGPATRWKKSWSTPIGPPTGSRTRGHGACSGNQNANPDCQSTARAGVSYPRDPTDLIEIWLPIATRSAAPSRSEDHGGPDDLSARDRHVCPSSGESPSDLCDTVGSGDPERPAV